VRSAKMILLVLVCLLGARHAAGEDFWLNKPYQKWSKAETEKMLHDSPWAQHVTLSAVAMAGFSTSAKGVTSVGNPTALAQAEHSEHPHLTYTAQLRSAMPIRQAVVRQRQLQEGYDSMAAEQKAALDAKTNAYLAQQQDEIVVYVTYDSTIHNYVDEARHYWSLQTYELLKNNVVLTIGSQRLAPTGYAAITGAFQFNFPRPADLPSVGSLTLEFMHPQLGALNSDRVVLEFKLNKMSIQGTPAI
jgi:hypothetical protein